MSDSMHVEPAGERASVEVSHDGLMVLVSEDGVWLAFAAPNVRTHALLSVEVLAQALGGPVTKGAVLGWAEGRRQAVVMGEHKRLSLATVIQRLYASEINCGLQSFWDGGVMVWLGDDSNGRQAAKGFGAEDLDEAAEWLDDSARLYYPDSEYAKAGA